MGEEVVYRSIYTGINNRICYVTLYMQIYLCVHIMRFYFIILNRRRKLKPHRVPFTFSTSLNRNELSKFFLKNLLIKKMLSEKSFFYNHSCISKLNCFVLPIFFSIIIVQLYQKCLFSPSIILLQYICIDMQIINRLTTKPFFLVFGNFID